MYSRICIFGRPGSGKSTFAFKLHQKIGLPVYYLDQFYFKENWAKSDYQQFLAMQHDIVDQNQWIIDGNCLKSLQIRYERADIVLYFNYFRLVCLFRLIKRLFSKDLAIKDRALGCKEALRWDLFAYMWRYEERMNYRVLNLISELRAQYPQVKFIEIHNDKELKEVWKLFIQDKEK